MPELRASGSRVERKTQQSTAHNPEECVHCRMYAKHLEGPLVAPTETYSEMFCEGVYQGRLLQDEEDRRLHEDSVAKFRRQIESMEAEMALLRDQLVAVQMAYDDVTMVVGQDVQETGQGGMMSARHEARAEVANGTRQTEGHPLNMHSTPQEAGNWGFDAADYVGKHEHFKQILWQLGRADERRAPSNDIDPDVDRYSIASDSDNESLHSAITVSSSSTSNNPSRSRSVAPQPRREDTPELTSTEVYSLLIDAQDPGGDEARDTVALLLEDAEQTPQSSRTNAQLFLLRHYAKGRLSGLESPTRSSPTRPPTLAELTIDQMISLIVSTAGHTEGEALDRVNQLFEEAEKTPRSARTAAQSYLLRYWRRPSEPSPTLVPPTSLPSDRGDAMLNTESFTPSAEVYVDASWFGVGFVLDDGRWLAWKFKRGHPEIPKGPDGNIVMSWAEIIAAELGIRTLIAAGYKNTTIILRSDNYGVIMALSRHTWTTNYGVDEILQRILRLCSSVGLVVMPVWVPTRFNPADGPSRGFYPRRSMRFGHVPELPDYLEPFVSQV